MLFLLIFIALAKIGLISLNVTTDIRFVEIKKHLKKPESYVKIDSKSRPIELRPLAFSASSFALRSSYLSEFPLISALLCELFCEIHLTLYQKNSSFH